MVVSSDGIEPNSPPAFVAVYLHEEVLSARHAHDFDVEEQGSASGDVWARAAVSGWQGRWSSGQVG